MPTLTDAQKAEICERIADGETVRQICADEHMPAKSTLFLALAKDEEFAKAYALARDAQLDWWEEELIEIADDGSNDWVEREGANGEKKVALDREHIDRSKLRVDARKWLMAKRRPKKYGDRVTQELTGADGAPLAATLNVTISPAEPASPSQAGDSA